MSVQTINLILSTLTVVAQAVIVVVIIQFFVTRRGSKLRGLAGLFGKHALLLAFKRI